MQNKITYFNSLRNEPHFLPEQLYPRDYEKKCKTPYYPNYIYQLNNWQYICLLLKLSNLTKLKLQQNVDII